MASDSWETPKGRASNWVPPNWEPPKVLLAPTGSPPMNLAVQMIGSNIIGNDLILAVAEFVAAEARLEMWMARLDPPIPLSYVFPPDRSSSNALRIAYEAWVVYEKAHILARGKVRHVANERAALLAAVRESTAILLRAQERPPVE